jgi:zinc transport system ATP-binding protein
VTAPHAADAQGNPHHHHGGACCGHAHACPVRESAIVSLRGIRFARSGRTILDRVDLDIVKGEIVTLIGPNGAGKTTLVRLILGLAMPDGGSIERGDGLRIGYVPQRFDVDPALPMTVARFLAIGVDAAAHETEATLNSVGAAHLRERQLSVLSGGELQRVLIARAVLRNPDLLVLDEPVRGVDYSGEAELYRLITALRDARGFAVLLVSHDLHIVMAASDRVLCLNHHVCCSGKPETVAQHPEYVRLFGPEAARALAVYQHRHDHAHDLDGAPRLPSPSWGGAGGGGKPESSGGGKPESSGGGKPESSGGGKPDGGRSAIPPSPSLPHEGGGRSEP